MQITCNLHCGVSRRETDLHGRFLFPLPHFCSFPKELHVRQNFKKGGSRQEKFNFFLICGKQRIAAKEITGRNFLLAKYSNERNVIFKLRPKNFSAALLLFCLKMRWGVEGGGQKALLCLVSWKIRPDNLRAACATREIRVCAEKKIFFFRA